MKKFCIIILIQFTSICSFSQFNCLLDTITKNQSFLKYVQANDTMYSVIWGNYLITRKITIPCYCSFDGGIKPDFPTLLYENKSFLVINEISQYSGAYNNTPLEYRVTLLPLNLKDSLIKVENYLRHFGNYFISQSSGSEIHIFNINNKRRQVINLYPNPALHRGSNINFKQMEIRNHIFFVKYEAINYRTGKVFFVNKKFPIKIF